MVEKKDEKADGHGGLPKGYVQQLSNPYAKGGFRAARTQLMRVRDIDAMFPVAANLAGGVFLLLLILSYGLTPREEWQYPLVDEQSAAWMGFVTLFLSTVFVLVPAAFQRRVVKESQTTAHASSTRIAGIVYAALLVQVCSILTNFMLAFCPNVVKIDPVTTARVFYTRWCEFVPLSGLMTFLCEAVDMPKTKNGARSAVIFSVFQSLSTLCGMIFPLCTSFKSWLITMTFSFAFYLPIFWRLWMKYQKYKVLPPPGTASSFMEEESNERIRLAYRLLFLCTIAWTVFVSFYFINLSIRTLLPEDHFLRVDSLALIMDTLFDVIAKAFYMLVIVDIHHKLENHHW